MTVSAGLHVAFDALLIRLFTWPSASGIDPTMFVETHAAIYFYSQRDETYGFLSNFEPCRFSTEAGRFYSSEQYFMKRKQERFDPDNTQLAIQIMKAKAAPVAKRLGRQVKNYDDEVWRAERFGVMVDALKLKFSQNDELERKLLATGSKKLYEAAPRDAIWGIGLSVEKIAAMFRNDEVFRISGDVDPGKQRAAFGSNLLGRALTETRGYLRARKTSEASAASTSAAASDHEEEE